MKKPHCDLPPIGSIVLSRYGREMRVVKHYVELHGVGVVALDDPTCSAHWKREWCICSGDYMPWEYYEWETRREELLKEYRFKLVGELKRRVGALIGNNNGVN